MFLPFQGNLLIVIIVYSLYCLVVSLLVIMTSKFLQDACIGTVEKFVESDTRLC